MNAGLTHRRAIITSTPHHQAARQTHREEKNKGKKNAKSVSLDFGPGGWGGASAAALEAPKRRRRRPDSRRLEARPASSVPPPCACPMVILSAARYKSEAGGTHKTNANGNPVRYLLSLSSFLSRCSLSASDSSAPTGAFTSSECFSFDVVCVTSPASSTTVPPLDDKGRSVSGWVAVG